ncbi:MAG: prolipoprotein diacylglyceryl transferase [Tissierellia bacterium]|nr:prolipoprotein diacylglyceryl transferase [Tissierellia bacterium]
MNPVAFTIGSFEIRWYGLLIAMGMAIGIFLAIKETEKYQLISEDTFMDFMLWMIPSAIIGARLYYVVFKWDYYAQNISEIINIREGGLAIHGGIIGAVIAGLIYCRLKRISFWQMADIISPSLILGQAIGRWGNYANGEAHGGPTNLPWAISVNGINVHPTFFYEFIWDLGIFVILYFFLKKKKSFDGQIFSVYLVGYSIGRFLIEGLRTDSLMLGPLRIAQVISILMIVLGVVIYKLRSTEKAKKN